MYCMMGIKNIESVNSGLTLCETNRLMVSYTGTKHINTVKLIEYKRIIILDCCG